MKITQKDEVKAVRYGRKKEMFKNKCWYGSCRIALLAMVVICIPTLRAGTRPSNAHADTAVIVSGRVTGFLPAPCNCQTDVILAVVARGQDSALDGSGVGHATTAVTNSFYLSGSIDGPHIVLNGSIIRSTSPYLVGSAVRIEADSETQQISYTLWPAAGPFRHQTLIFNGTGKVIVSNE
jgi:hypothetical protein